ncbi:MAG: tRNA 4-thiouridine(8) synthase ThiI [Acidobacteria bacterium]|nr:MAG: tRNA 4-thiouridine(8) synthase ThiI [Acidobacteriota bacterium]
MEMVTKILATTNEVSLKGGNRKWFEQKITDNVKNVFEDLPLDKVQRPRWRVLVSFTEPVPFREVARRMSTVFSIASIMPVEWVGQTTDDVIAALPDKLEGLAPSSFAVRCLRSDKTFPKTSVELERDIGGAVVDLKGWKVDLTHPDLTVHLLVDRDGLYLWTRRVAGPGGLPRGSGGRATCLLSGGIDSPVAAYQMMKRGVRLDFVHFHSVPRTDPASLEKTIDLARILARYQGRCRLAMVPLLPIQEKIVANCPTRLRVLLYRRFMIRIAQRVASRFKGRALVTGESLGQVASQTIENLAAVQAIARLPIIRPLITLDKQEIINTARRLGSFETSILPHFDCCSFLVPEHPATRSTHQELSKAEEALDIDTLVAEAISGIEIIKIDQPAPWSDIPIPAGAEDLS